MKWVDNIRFESQAAALEKTAMDSVTTIQRNLTRLIAERDTSPTRLSLDAGLSRSYVVDLMKGRVRSPRQESLEKLAHALRVSPQEITTDQSYPDQLRRLHRAFDRLPPEQREQLVRTMEALAPAGGSDDEPDLG